MDKNDSQYSQTTNIPLTSIYGRRCLTKCYPKNNIYLHPILLGPIGSKLHNTCAIYPAYNTKSEYTITDMIILDECKVEDNKSHQVPNALDSMSLYFYFNPKDFLSTIYDLNSFSEVIYWTLDMQHLPFETIKRVHDCSWKVFGLKLEELTNVVIDYYYNISKAYWLKEYTTKIESDYSFELMSDDRLDSTNSTNSANQSDQSDQSDISNSTFTQLYNTILEKYYTYNFFSVSMKNYIYDYEDKWDLIVSHYDNIKQYMFDKLVEEINKNLTK